MKTYDVIVRVEGATSWNEAEMGVIASFAKRLPDGMSFHIQPETPTPDPFEEWFEREHSNLLLKDKHSAQAGWDAAIRWKEGK